MGQRREQKGIDKVPGMVGLTNFRCRAWPGPRLCNSHPIDLVETTPAEKVSYTWAEAPDLHSQSPAGFSGQ